MTFLASRKNYLKRICALAHRCVSQGHYIQWKANFTNSISGSSLNENALYPSGKRLEYYGGCLTLVQNQESSGQRNVTSEITRYLDMFSNEIKAKSVGRSAVLAKS